MMFLATVIALALISTVVAIPSAPKKDAGLYQLATFEDVKELGLVAADPIDIYDGIYWQGMSLGQASRSSLAPGVIPRSLYNYAAFGFTDVATEDQDTPQMTVVYPESTIKIFNLEYFYFGCALGTEEGLTSLPLPCSLTVEGYNPKGKMIASNTFYFAGGGRRKNMVQAMTPGFNGLQYVQFTLTAEETTAAVMDSFSYRLFS